MGIVYEDGINGRDSADFFVDRTGEYSTIQEYVWIQPRFLERDKGGGCRGRA